MWFDVGAHCRKSRRDASPSLTLVARVARPLCPNRKLHQAGAKCLHLILGRFTVFLGREGPHTFGVHARELGIEATRVWQA